MKNLRIPIFLLFVCYFQCVSSASETAAQTVLTFKSADDLQDATPAELSPQSFADAPTPERASGVRAERGKKDASFVTRPFLIQGGETLLLDADASNGGAVFVVLLDEDGKEIPGYGMEETLMMMTDNKDYPVTWNSFRQLPTDSRNIRLKVFLNGATIYAVKLRKEQPKAESPLHVGTARQLFADPAVIETLGGGARLDVKQPQDRGVVFTLDKPWEGNTSAYFTVLKSEDKYQLYYRGLHHPDGKQAHRPYACYAESTDGIHWTRPNLGQVEFDGSTENNILDLGKQVKNSLNMTPFIDPNPDANPAEKYKAIAGEVNQISAYVSPDGIKWSQVGEGQVITGLYADSQNTPMFDPDTGLYCAYVRVWTRGRRVKGIRGIVRLTSKDFRTWSDPEWLTYPDASVAHLYTNNILPYYRAPHLMVGFPCRMPDKAQNVEPLFMLSRDGLTFQRWDETVIRAGRNPRQWGNRCNYLWYGMAETELPYNTEQQEISVYAGEDYYRGDAVKLRRYVYRPDGFVSVNAPFSGGEVTTKPIIADGPALYLNYSTAAGGHVEVDILDESGNLIRTSRRMVGDEVDARVHFVNFGIPVGKPIRLRFRMSDADIYSFQFLEK